MNDTGIYARELPGLDRVVQVGLASGRVVSVSFPGSVPDDADTAHPLLDRIEAHFEGTPDRFDDVSVALTVPTDRRAVLDAVRKLPPGERVPVARLARLAGLDGDDEGDRALVEAALADNPVPLFVPDHRVDGPGVTPDDVARWLRRVEQSGS